MAEFNAENQETIDKLLRVYPERQATLLPVLHLAQEQFGGLDEDVVELVSRRLELPESEIREVISFYTMFHEEPLGEYHVQVCHNLSCTLMGAEKLIRTCERKLGIKAAPVRGETTEDGRFTLTRVECLACCDGAPMIQINDQFYLNLTPAGLEALLDELA